MIGLVQAERLVLGSLVHPSAVAIRMVDDLPAEAFADPLHQNLFWHLLVGAEPTAVPDDADGSSYLAELVAVVPSIQAPETTIIDACSLIRRCWVERRQLDAEDAARPNNVVELATWSPRGVA